MQFVHPTYNRGTVQAIHVDHCASTSIACTSTSTHPRTIGASFGPPMPKTVHIHVQGARPRTRIIGASLRRPMPNIVHIHVRGSRSTPLTCNGYTAQATHTRYIALTAHAEHYAIIRTHTSARKVHQSVRTCRTPYTDILTAMGTRLGLHLPTSVHAHINAHTSKGAPLGLHMPNAVPYAHPRKIRLTSSIINFNRTLGPGK